ncbi:MAG: hypothetical protein JXR25_11350 [Pontiellaceae bacterium]|nr:hypothetical protein [Pontiellaceae bacterium]MBN2785409.1 hypothetical protein [Pontiellaceae bacterium]
MERDETIQLLHAAIDVELAMGELYAIFATTLPDDREFWSQLHLEEKHHASLLRTALDSFSNRALLAERLLPDSLVRVKNAHRRIIRLIAEFRNDVPDRKAACRLSILLEREIGEEHYNQFMHQIPESPIESVFQQLNLNDKDHAERITSYLNELEIQEGKRGSMNTAGCR